MGVGDKPKRFTGDGRKTRCDVTMLELAACAVRECPNPSVIRRYGYEGKVNISIYICRRCRYGKSIDFTGIVRCGYEV